MPTTGSHCPLTGFKNENGPTNEICSQNRTCPAIESGTIPVLSQACPTQVQAPRAPATRVLTCRHRRVAVDREIVESSFRQWQQEMEIPRAIGRVGRALDAHQLHLDSWQQELAHERTSCGVARGVEAAIGRRPGRETNYSSRCSASRPEMKEKVVSLTTLLSRTEEPGELSTGSGGGMTELTVVREREKQLTDRLDLQETRESQRNRRPTIELSSRLRLGEPRRGR